MEDNHGFSLREIYPLSGISGNNQVVNNLKINEILYLKSDNSSTDFFTEKGERFTSTTNIGTHEEALAKRKCGIIRIHASYMVNLYKVSKIIKGDKPCIVLLDKKTTLPVSDKYKKVLFSIFHS